MSQSLVKYIVQYKSVYDPTTKDGWRTYDEYPSIREAKNHLEALLCGNPNVRIVKRTTTETIVQ